MVNTDKEPNPYTTERSVMMVSMLVAPRDHVWAMDVGGFVCAFFVLFFIIILTTNTAFVIQVIICGLKVDEELDATHHLCTKTHLY